MNRTQSRRLSKMVMRKYIIPALYARMTAAEYHRAYPTRVFVLCDENGFPTNSNALAGPLGMRLLVKDDPTRH